MFLLNRIIHFLFMILTEAVCQTEPNEFFVGQRSEPTRSSVKNQPINTVPLNAEMHFQIDLMVAQKQQIDEQQHKSPTASMEFVYTDVPHTGLSYEPGLSNDQWGCPIRPNEIYFEKETESNDQWGCPIRPNEIYFEKETESNDQWSCPIRPNEIYFEKETDEKHFFHGELEKILENSANRQLIVKDSIDLINDDRKPHLITLNRESFEYFKHILPQVGNDKILVFDIDNTLYPEKSQAEYKIHQKYLEWLEKQTGISKFEINKLSKEPSHINDEFPYMVHRKLNLWPGHYNHMIQSIDYTQLIKRNEQLKEFLDTLPYRKFCLTNNSVHGATKILNVLGIDSCFEAIFAIDLDVTRSEILKPTESAYKFVTEILQVKNNKNIIFFDDKEKNVHGAIKCGWNATQIKSDDEIIVLVSEKMAEYWKVV